MTTPKPTSPEIHLGAPFLYHGGAEKQFRYLVQVLLNAGATVKIHVLSSVDTEQLTQSPFLAQNLKLEVIAYNEDILRLRSRPWRWLALILSVWRKMKSADVSYFYTAYFIPLVPLLRLQGSYVIYSERIYSEKMLNRQALYYLLRFANEIVVNGQSLFEYFQKRFPTVTLIRNKVEPIRWHHRDPPFPRRISADAPPVRVAIISRYDPFKNIEFALKAIARRPDIKVNTYGTGQSQFRRLLERDARIRGDNVSFHDPHSIEQIYDTNDIIVHPSLAEGTPNVLLEAMASRKIVLASNIRENRDTGIIEQWLFDPYDSQSLNDCIDRLFASTQAEREKILTLHENHIRTQYGADQFCRSVRQLFTLPSHQP